MSTNRKTSTADLEKLAQTKQLVKRNTEITKEQGRNLKEAIKSSSLPDSRKRDALTKVTVSNAASIAESQKKTEILDMVTDGVSVTNSYPIILVVDGDIEIVNKSFLRSTQIENFEYFSFMQNYVNGLYPGIRNSKRSLGTVVPDAIPLTNRVTILNTSPELLAERSFDPTKEGQIETLVVGHSIRFTKKNKDIEVGRTTVYVDFESKDGSVDSLEFDAILRSNGEIIVYTYDSQFGVPSFTPAKWGCYTDGVTVTYKGSILYTVDSNFDIEIMPIS